MWCVFVQLWICLDATKVDCKISQFGSCVCLNTCSIVGNAPLPARDRLFIWFVLWFQIKNVYDTRFADPKQRHWNLYTHTSVHVSWCVLFYYYFGQLKRSRVQHSLDLYLDWATMSRGSQSSILLIHWQYLCAHIHTHTHVFFARKSKVLI